MFDVWSEQVYKSEQTMKLSEVFCCVFLLLVVNVAYLNIVESLFFSQFTLMQVRIILSNVINC